ncbi:uncharacterized protein LOC119676018 [Teleopsis dalmanni]|uniref:uncharacterized protein LOC119676018 n=1 Tax=Teleopsis dalmanni TaxID=139649 RepID=UPI0018CF48CC|nr:uncharacterized protein LOC119676018 [Teleopsis dalmanni]
MKSFKRCNAWNIRTIKSLKSSNGLSSIFAFIFLLILQYSSAHFIQIDHNEFRASGFPRPHLPPPLPHAEQLLQHSPTKELTPAELLVDLSNDLTYRILHFHSILNRNNFAFSPTALMSVLVALYEGSSGKSALELRNVLQLPNNIDIIRVGYRDIHRRLRTYFFGSDNPLKGLSLNKENVTITKYYESILTFYGYDLSVDMVSACTTSAVSENSTVTPLSEVTPAIVETTTTTTLETTTINDINNITTTEEIQITTQTSNTPNTSSEATSTSTTINNNMDATIDQEITTINPNSVTDETTSTSTDDTTALTDDTLIETTTSNPTDVTENPAAEIISPENINKPSARIRNAHPINLIALSAPITSRNKYLPTTRSAMKSIRSTANRNKRQKRHLYGVKGLDANLFVTLFNPRPHHHNLTPLSGPSAAVALDNTFDVNLDEHIQQETDIKHQNYNTDVISHIFYLGNQQIVHTTYKVYNAVLYYKYFETLKMSVLELELDTPEYNLMILLPDYNSDLVSAAASLRLGPTLRTMRKQLKPRWVQAIIPDFKLHGTMFLTNDLQNMGICDIFEPTRADFHSMTDAQGIYVKHIEQSINVNIRTHPINQLKRNYGIQMQPIQISVNHPFLFFIIDRDLEVAVMSGRILNPLNVRIQ